MSNRFIISKGVFMISKLYLLVYCTNKYWNCADTNHSTRKKSESHDFVSINFASSSDDFFFFFFPIEAVQDLIFVVTTLNRPVYLFVNCS